MEERREEEKLRCLVGHIRKRTSYVVLLNTFVLKSVNKPYPIRTQYMYV